MAKKTIAKSRPKAGAKAALAARSKDATDAPKAKSGFGKRSMAAGTAAARTKTAPKTRAKPAGKSVIGKAVGAVTSTVSSVAESATSLFKRNAPKSR